MASNDFSAPLTRREARELLRLILSDLVGRRRLMSRELLNFLASMPGKRVLTAPAVWAEHAALSTVAYPELGI